MTPKKQENEKVEELKKLFYTELSSYEIQELLQITPTEYNKLLIQTKKSLGLKSSYRRIPSKLLEYKENKYYIAHKTDDDFEIISYTPTMMIAEETLNYYKETNPLETYYIKQATKEHMLDLIEDAYFNKEQTWSTIMIKLKLSYSTFYELLNLVKKKKGTLGTRTGKRLRYIYPASNVWKIMKNVDGEQLNFGYYTNIEDAIRIRDYLEKINWNYTVWNNHKIEIVEELTG